MGDGETVSLVWEVAELRDSLRFFAGKSEDGVGVFWFWCWWMSLCLLRGGRWLRNESIVWWRRE